MEPETDAQRPEVDASTRSTPDLIRCTDLKHTFIRGRRSHILPWRSGEVTSATTALDGVSLGVASGEIVGIAGPSGSGKSTLLHLIAGLLTPSAGKIEVAGTDVAALSATERTAFRHEHIGLVFQRFHLLSSLSARANVALPLVQSGIKRSRRRRKAEALLERIGLGDRIDHTPGQLSGGEQQRVAIARALVTDPEVVLADEPTGELDSETGRTVLDILTNLADEQAVVVASHDERALSATDRVVHLSDGQRLRER